MRTIDEICELQGLNSTMKLAGLEKMIVENISFAEAVEALGYKRNWIEDEEKICKKIFDENRATINGVLQMIENLEEDLIKRLLREMMQGTGGRVNPKVVREGIVRQLIVIKSHRKEDKSEKVLDFEVNP